jgi:glutathione synthase/RimK-type ligase-like ATP-grasp enzyme
MKKFVKAAENVGFGVRMLTKEDYGRILEHDALFIRTTTSVNHYTYRFARRAANEGLVVIDSPEDILRCTNKVYQAELMQRHGIATPNTLVVHKGNVDRIVRELGLPCVLKQPDSAFSHGVIKVETEAELEQHTTRLLASSELIVAQRFLPTAYDWRVGVFDRRSLYACRYHMARKHWQIAKNEDGGKRSYGRVEWVARADAPAFVLDTAVRAANLIGDGLYGVDLKEIDGRACVIEINDNPNIDAGLEDQELAEELYMRIMQGFLRRVQDRQLQRGGA